MWIESMSSFEMQCTTEGLQIDRAGLNTQIQSQMVLSDNWPDSSLQVSIKHFMCTPLGEMELVRNMGHRSYARHRI